MAAEQIHLPVIVTESKSCMFIGLRLTKNLLLNRYFLDSSLESFCTKSSDNVRKFDICMHMCVCLSVCGHKCMPCMLTQIYMCPCMYV